MIGNTCPFFWGGEWRLNFRVMVLTSWAEPAPLSFQWLLAFSQEKTSLPRLRKPPIFLEPLQFSTICFPDISPLKKIPAAFVKAQTPPSHERRGRVALAEHLLCVVRQETPQAISQDVEKMEILHRMNE